MSRRSADSLSVITAIPGQRLRPPSRLSREAQAVWRAVVATRPHDWFSAADAPLLEAYCNAVVGYRLVSKRVAAFNLELLEDDLEVLTFDRLTKIADRQARVLASMATKLRLTQQSRYTPKAAGTAAGKVKGGAKPWEQ